MAQSFTGAAFAQALASNELLFSFHLDGMAKPGRDAKHIAFAPGTRCGPHAWVEIPVAVIDHVEPLFHIPCADHDHPFVRIFFKLPAAANAEATVFAELLRRTVAGQADEAAAEAGRDALTERSFDLTGGFGGPCPKQLCAYLCKRCQKEGGIWCRLCRDCWDSCRGSF